MPLHRLLLVPPAICAALSLSACGDDGGKAGAGGAGGAAGAAGMSGGGVGGGAGNGGAAGMGPDCAHIDYASYASGDSVSFRDDILPIVGFGCTATSCHNPDAQKAGLNLGWHCNYDMPAKWSCTFPATPDPDSPTTKPDDEATIAAVYASLKDTAKTVNGGSVKRVVPGDPENSFLIVKLVNQQDKKGYMCTNQDPMASVGACGVSMPLNGELWCQGNTRTRFDAIARWIAQGAQDN